MGLVLKQHDTKPDLVVTLTDDQATFEQVASWRVIMRRGSDAAFIDDAPAVVADDTVTPHTATITHTWQPSETDTATYPGMRVEVEATWPDGSIQTFPPSGYLSVVITPDLA